jgi:hypothetical protein
VSVSLWSASDGKREEEQTFEHRLIAFYPLTLTSTVLCLGQPFLLTLLEGETVEAEDRGARCGWFERFRRGFESVLLHRYQTSIVM